MSGPTPRGLGLAHFTVLEVPPHDLVTLAAKIGYVAIGLRLHPAFPGAPFYELPVGSESVRHIKAKLNGEGIRVHDIEFVVVDQSLDIATLEPMLASAAELGARRLSVCGDDPDPKRMAARFGDVCDLAYRHGLGVDLECMAWRQVASVPAALKVVRAAGRPNGGVLIDALHLARTDGSPNDLVDIPSEFLVSAQLCDAPLAKPTSMEGIIAEARGGRLAPGDGDLPLDTLVAILPAWTVISIEAPMSSSSSSERRAALLFSKAMTIIERSSPHKCGTGAGR